MKIVITGALGHIGSYVLRDLAKMFPECEVMLLDNLSTQRYASLFSLPAGARYRFHEIDILDDDFHGLCEGANCILHFAAITNAAASFANKEEVEYNNLNATRLVAGYCKDANVPLLHLSSTSVYGTQADVVDENCSAGELVPQSPYAATKLKEERHLEALSRDSELQYSVLRFGTIAGVSPGMRFHTAVNKFCWQAVMGQDITVWRTALHQKRPYLALTDASRAIGFFIDQGLFDGRVYNIVTENLTVNDILTHIKQHIPSLQVDFVDTEIMNQLSYEVANQRIIDQGFTFSGSIETCIAETIDLLRGVRAT